MMNSRTLEIHKKCDEQFQIISNIYLLKLDVKNFYEATDEIKENIFSKYSLISRINGLTIRQLIIQIYILVKEDQSYSFYKLIRLVKKEKGFIDLHQEEWKRVFSMVEDLQENSTWQKIKILRNKHYAHIDHLRFDHDSSITMKQIVKFADLLELIYTKLFWLIKDKSELMLSSLENDTGHYLYEALYGYHKIWELYEKYELSRDDRLISPNSIRAILFKKQQY